eukprot:GHRR01029920.1.p1 GENE.GHRR01029920.1~~GHRR01029920.1.p1  ORF type:complete len:120 (-),score=25.74 GHRR01029920.1:447-806(-)
MDKCPSRVLLSKLLSITMSLRTSACLQRADSYLTVVVVTVIVLQVNNGALYLPPGVYRLTKALDIRKAILLRGAGKGLTTIYIPVSLTDVYGNTWSEVSGWLAAEVLHLSTTKCIICIQ